jgi:hypothetical protein
MMSGMFGTEFSFVLNQFIRKIVTNQLCPKSKPPMFARIVEPNPPNGLGSVTPVANGTPF